MDARVELRKRRQEAYRRRYLWEKAARAKGTHTDGEFRELCAEAGSRCLRCEQLFFAVGGPSRDHIVPISTDGSDAIENIQPLCRRCNASKNDVRMDYRPDHMLRAAELYDRVWGDMEGFRDKAAEILRRYAGAHS